jgi:hypothetical protein
MEGFGVDAEKSSINKFLSLAMLVLPISSTFCSQAILDVELVLLEWCD